MDQKHGLSNPVFLRLAFLFSDSTKEQCLVLEECALMLPLFSLSMKMS